MVRCPQKRSFDVEIFFLDLSFLRHDEVSVYMPSRVILDELTQIPGQYYLIEPKDHFWISFGQNGLLDSPLS